MHAIRGGRSREPRVAGLPVALVEPERLPREADALVVEDDTYFVLGASPEFTEPTEHPIRIWTRLHRTEPASPGFVRASEGSPLKLHAVVHDLSEEPTWRETWIGTAISGVLREVGRRGLRTLALPVLGGVHGKLPADRFLVLLRTALEAERPDCLARLWLVAKPETLDALRRSLDEEQAGQARREQSQPDP